MDVYFANRKLEVLGMASTELPDAYLLYNDLETFSITEGVSIFEGYIPFIKGTRRDINRTVKVGNYIIFENEEKESKFYTIIRTEKDRKNDEIYFYAEDAGLDLLNEIAEPFEADDAHPVSWYINKYLEDSGFEIGINEIPDLTRKLKWEGETTVTKRLLSIATQFDNAEISYSFDFADYAIKRKYINIYKKRGTRSMIELTLDREVDNIVTTETIEELATALKCYGATPEGADSPITLDGYKYDDGRFFTDGGVLKDRQSNAKWSRYLSENGNGDGYLTRTFSHEGATTQAELLNRAMEKLKKISEIEVNFDVSIVDFNEKIQIGDTVSVIDDDDELYLEARVLKLARSRSNETYQATLGEYLITDSGIDSKLQELADKVSKIKAGDTYYPWVRYADDDQGNGISAMPLNKKYMAIKYAKNQPTPSDDPNDYKGLWTLIKGSDGQQGIPGPAGADGQTKYMWIMYADTATGSGISSNPDGKMYIGVAFNQTEETPSTNPRDYNWSAMYDTKKLDDVINQVNSIVYPVSSPTAPTNPKEGMQWWQTDIANDNSVIGYFVYKNGEWQPQTIQQAILNVVNLNAVNITGSTITGTNITGSAINNTFTIVDQEYTLTGTSTLKDAKLAIDYVVKETGQYGVTEVTPSYVGGSTFKGDGTLQQSYQLSSSGLTLINANNVGGLQAEYLVDYPWRYLSLNSGYTWYDTSTNKYRPKAKLIYIGPNPFLQFFGIVIRNTAGGGGGSWVAFGSLDLEAMKVKQFITADANMTISVGNGDGATLGLQTSGVMVVRTPSNWKEMRLGGLMPLS